MAQHNLIDWIAARTRHGLSHAQVQMARELASARAVELSLEAFVIVAEHAAVR